MRTLTIMHLIDSGGLYGAERILLDLATECRDRGHTVIVVPIVAPQDPGDLLGDAARAAQLEVRPFVVPDGLHLRAFDAVLDAARAARVDVIHSHGYKANILLALTPKRSRPCPVVATLHGWTARRSLSKMGVYETVERLLLRRLDHVVAVSPTIKRRVPRIARRGAVRVVPNGIAPRVTSETGPDGRVLEFITGRPSILAAGRLSPEKGFDVLLEAMAIVVRAMPDVRLVIAGEGPAKVRLQALIAARELAHNVLLPGYMANIRGTMKLFGVYALSSYTEGLPAVILEAMAEGLPVVATQVGAVPQALDAGHCGRLVPPGDPRALSTALLEMLQDRTLAGTLSTAAYSRFSQHYSSPAMADAYCELYRAAAGRQ